MKKSNPQRRCISCMTSYPQQKLIRMVRNADRIIVDTTGHLEGRGLYICKNKECIERAFKRAMFNKCCRCKFDIIMLQALENELTVILEEETNVKENQ